MVKVRNTNNLHIYESWDAAHITGHTHTHTHTHTFWQECRKSYIPHTDFHSHYDSTVLCRTTRDTRKLCGHKSTMHPGKEVLLYMKTKKHYFPTESRAWQNWMEVNGLPHGPSHIITRVTAIGTHWIGGWVALESVWTFFGKYINLLHHPCNTSYGFKIHSVTTECARSETDKIAVQRCIADVQWQRQHIKI